MDIGVRDEGLGEYWNLSRSVEFQSEIRNPKSKIQNPKSLPLTPIL
jgi:hypothetical protein